MPQCWFTIAAIKTGLRTRGFGRTIQWIRRRVEAVPEVTLVNSEVIKTTECAVAMAGALYPGRALCLEQSLTLYCLLRRQGVAVKYCQGVQPYPFRAHSWVEYNGEPINDVAEHVRSLARLPDQLP